MQARSVLLAVAVAGCGGSTTRSPALDSPTRAVSSPTPPASKVLDLDCENTFGVTQGFVGGSHSRYRPVRVGPITIARGTAIGGGRTAPHTFVSKLPVLLRPDTRIALEIDVGLGRKGGFFSITRNGGGLVTAPPSAGHRHAYVGPCPRLPHEAHPSTTSHSAMGLFITTTRPGCATLTVRWDHHRKAKRIRLGVRRCARSH